MDEETTTWALELLDTIKSDIKAELGRWQKGEQVDINALLANTIAGVHSLADVVEALVKAQRPAS